MSYKDVAAAYHAIPRTERTFDILCLMEEMYIIHASNSRGDWRVSFARMPHVFNHIEAGTGVPFPDTQTIFPCYCHPDMDEQEPEGGWDSWVCPHCNNTGWYEKE